MNHLPTEDPTEDPALSPHTGWTRAHWETAADRLLAAVRPFANPSGSLIRLPGPASGSGEWSDGLEGYARTFLLASFRAAHAEPEHAERILAPYAAGLAAGTDPDSPERWPSPSETRQARVEAASVALALHETRPLLWDRLPERVRENTVRWLSELSGVEVPPNNWVWFRAVVAAFLRSVDAPHAAADIAHAIEATDSWYVGGGWYTDGGTDRFDHYNGWAMHLYPLWYCRISGDHEPLARYRERLRAFLDDAVHLVGGDGAPLFQGRSLTYRFAAAAPFLTGALFDATPLPPGLTRRAASGMLRHFLDRGAVEERDLLSLGWHRRFEAIRQNYSGPASPYWASKGFLGLLLPPDHPVWTATEEPLPVERGDFTREIAAPGWLVSGTAADGVVRVVNHGTLRAPSGRDPFYARLAYTTHTAPELGPPDPAVDFRLDGDARLGDAGPDNQVAPGTRAGLERVALDDRVAISHHGALTVASAVHGPWEVRVVSPDEAARGRRLRLGGHALAADRPPAEPRPGVVRRQDGLTSALLVLHPPAEPPPAHRAEGTNPFGAHSATPWHEAPAEGPVAVAVFLGHTHDATLPPAPRYDPATTEVRWSDGTSARVTRD
ncbi:DUF2264 domain-containing protein [Streptomyces sp. 8K308]|uniref:DUF2264 domain-containing protein n=1 Tax=Streptomyces sp. 8K308 TaxID=2530388 RepID=UPI001FB7C006|nr:DUF2264 domain-containing protein [Streptomyces sp. 8K308]